MVNVLPKVHHKSFSKSSLYIIITTVIYAVMIWTYSWNKSDGRGFYGVINGDGAGYYMYLPNIFLNKSIARQIPDDRYILNHKGHGLNKYPAGTAISVLPFFGLGYLISYIQNDPLDGYSFYFRKAVSIAGLFYFVWGLIFMRKLLSLYKIRDSAIAAAIILISFATNLITYAVLEPSMSHIYSFFFITAFLYYVKMLIETERSGYFFILSFVLGMIILIRPINALVIFIVPFLAGSWFNLKKVWTFIFKARYMLIAGAAFLCTTGIQSLLWYMQTEDFIIWSYKSEGFYFTHPQIWNFLFSFRKGLFIYTPLCLLSLAGIYVVYRRSGFEFISLVGFLLILIYFFSSWWNWYYGPSFGQRVFVDFYGIIGLTLALLLDKTGFNIRGKIVYSLSFLLLALNLVQNYQYYKGIMSLWDMDFIKYKYIFLKTSPKFVDCLGGNTDILLYHADKKLVYQTRNDFETKYNDFNTPITTIDPQSKSTVCDYRNSEYNTLLNIPINKNLITQRDLFADVSIDRIELAPFSCSTALFVVELLDSTGRTYCFYQFHVNDVPSAIINTWKTFKYTIEIPRIKSVHDQMKFYVWNIKKMPFYIDNFDVKIYTID